MEKFTGFPEGNAGQIPIPIVFFHQLLPSITDPGELKLTIYTFYLFERTEGAFRYLRRADYCNDDLFMNSLSNDRDQAERILDLSLDLAQQRGTLLLTEMVIGSGKEKLYFLNSPRGRAAIKAIQNGQWTSGALAEPKTEVHTPNIFQLYEEHIGPLSPLIAEELGEAQDTYPAEWISEAFRIAAEKDKRSWRYVLAILSRWQREGTHGRKEKSEDRRSSPEARRRYVEGEYSEHIEH